jgi:hypothetical protein
MQLEVRPPHARADIPPGDADAQHTATYFFKRDAILYGVSPHMHLRGSWFKFELMTPDGKRQTLLSVPSYDFNWQTSYRLAEPLRVPAGELDAVQWPRSTTPRTTPTYPTPPSASPGARRPTNEMFMGFMDMADVARK